MRPRSPSWKKGTIWPPCHRATCGVVAYRLAYVDARQRHACPVPRLVLDMGDGETEWRSKVKRDGGRSGTLAGLISCGSVGPCLVNQTTIVGHSDSAFCSLDLDRLVPLVLIYRLRLTEARTAWWAVRAIIMGSVSPATACFLRCNAASQVDKSMVDSSWRLYL
ncbi:uncharacterized protein C8Q71DRAFT_291526 [Rhodofomes roseus]|uniref:Uncharacterized protein n=1 Tax=Rhodofomes roseus TaxID=34475 RepID=A0ABQ8K4K8_9APHY|nr:uncharacterized protein C8Q71DRAFT_291526 [Rhodofomes roseus]KAH9831551.1 hypothetical protein C8Q71DRAFT_291526 [Rhodofomes roseus]